MLRTRDRRLCLLSQPDEDNKVLIKPPNYETSRQSETYRCFGFRIEMSRADSKKLRFLLGKRLKHITVVVGQFDLICRSKR